MAAILRSIYYCRVQCHRCSLFNGPFTRGYRRSWVEIMKTMKARRIRAGPEPLRHRSVWNNWNYEAELYAFGKRLNEEFNMETLKMAFTHKSYLEQEEQKRKELGVPVSDVLLNLQDNSFLSSSGEFLMKTYIGAFLRHCYPLLPEEGIGSIKDLLMSDDVLSHVASNTGMADLMLCSDFPPEQSTLSTTLKAVIGAIAKDSGEHCAELFIQDFILVQLVGKDICDIWEISNPIIVLKNILKKQGKESPESRLIWQAACNTIQAVYHVGMYSNKNLIGQGSGETVGIAEEMAAYDALRRIFKITLDHSPLPFGKKGRQLNLNKEKINLYMNEWT